MSTLLRKVKSTISATSNPGAAESTCWGPSTTRLTARTRPNRPHHRDSERHSHNSSGALGQIQSERPLSEFRRRLARKASTFSLRAKRWRGELQARDQEEATRQGKKEGEEIFVSNRENIVGRRDETVNTTSIEAEYLRKDDGDSHTVYSVTTVKPATDTNIKSEASLPVADTKSSIPTSALQEYIREQQQKYVCKEEAGGKICVDMASEQAAPPVPYTRLKEITENACEAALSEVTSYSHPDTESWNTTIINSILGALVDETAKQSSGSGPAQPQFKYVVNSTIIQHAASSSDDNKKAKGRRGMHAASGAYWNNEKDGMWSYKYPGAESKGLDVVIGIIWIWVG